MGAPYTESDIRELTWVDDPGRSLSEEEKTAVFASVANQTFTFYGEPYAWANMTFTPSSGSSNSADEAGWRFLMTGHFGTENQTDGYQFQVRVQDGTSPVSIELTLSWKSAVKHDDVSATDNIAREHGNGIENTSYLSAVSWNPEWPACVRLEYRNHPPPFYTSDEVVIAFVDLIRGQVARVDPPTVQY